MKDHVKRRQPRAFDRTAVIHQTDGLRDDRSSGDVLICGKCRGRCSAIVLTLVTALRGFPSARHLMSWRASCRTSHGRERWWKLCSRADARNLQAFEQQTMRLQDFDPRWTIKCAVTAAIGFNHSFRSRAGESVRRTEPPKLGPFGP